MAGEMLEQVAYAIAKADPEQQGQIDDSEMGQNSWEKCRDRYLILARAAIEAMRFPTKEMEEAYRYGVGERPFVHLDDTRYDCMIKEALK